MFTRRRILHSARRYSREFFEAFVNQLSDAGFDDITVILPHNYESVDVNHSAVSVTEFLNRERNYAGVILRAHSSTKNETLKVLFKNSPIAFIKPMLVVD